MVLYSIETLITPSQAPPIDYQLYYYSIFLAACGEADRKVLSACSDRHSTPNKKKGETSMSSGMSKSMKVIVVMSKARKVCKNLYVGQNHLLK
jgi:hypothetical protein